MTHRIINPDFLAPAVGFAYAVESQRGRVLWLGGQNGHDAEGEIVGRGDLVAQFDRALENIVAVVRAAGGQPEHVVKLTLYVSDVQTYRENRKALGPVYRKHMGRHYPAMLLLAVAGFFDEEALIEIEGVAVIPDEEVVGEAVTPPASLT
ncbi:MAG: RidA family protein [Ardenticatenaceae bacterium]|nr:RidA family protein [Ardenticatenaceae bacterium]